MLYKLLVKILTLTVLLSMPVIPMSGAFFSDTEEGEANKVTTGVIDLSIRLSSDAFQSPPLIPGETATASAFLANDGTLPFRYGQEVTQATGSSQLCSSLNLKVWQYRYDSGGVLQKVIKYDGGLSGYTLNLTGSDTDLQNPTSYPYYPNLVYEDNEHWLWYEISLPSNAPGSLGSKTCFIEMTSKAWQETISYGYGFWDRETTSFSVSSGVWSKVVGSKYNDEDGDGVKDPDEEGLATWTIYGAEEVQKLTVSSDGTAQTTEPLEDGIKYLVRAKGTFSAGDGITADAKYAVKSPSTTWTDTVEGYESWGPTLLDLQIDTASPDWGTYNADHDYWLPVEGEGNPLTFSIYDIHYQSNSGSLEVTLYKTVVSTVTDENGRYELDLSSTNGEVIIAEEPKTGWVQTAPALGHFIFKGKGVYENWDFGNQEVLTPPDRVKIVINEVYYDVGGGKGSETLAQCDEWVELYNPNNFEVNLKDWTLTDNGETRTISHSNKYIPANGFAVLAKNAQTWGYWTIPTGAATIELGQNIGDRLNNAGDRLILKNPQDETVDQLSWGDDTTVFNPSISDVAEGHSIARSPLGYDTDAASDWADLSNPNPGTNPHSHIQTQVNQVENDLIIGFTNAYGFDAVKYSITYNRSFYGTTLDEAIEGEAKKFVNQDTLILPPFYLGTCSSLGVVCVPHTVNGDIKINLLYKNEQELLGESQIIYQWKP